MLVCRDKHPENAELVHKIVEIDRRIQNRHKYPNWRCYGCGAPLETTRCDYCGKLNAYPPVEGRWGW